MRDLNAFSEFQLGQLRYWSDEQGAHMLVRRDLKLVQVTKGHDVIMYWQYGQAMMFLLDGVYCPPEELPQGLPAGLDVLVSQYSESS